MSVALTPWTLSLAAAACLFAVTAVVLMTRIRSKGRLVDAFLGASLVIFLAVLFVGTLETAAVASVDAVPVEATVLPAGESEGTCASLEPGDQSSEATEALGKPDRVEPASHLRGPGAEIWHYDASRCAVHVFEGKIEFID